MMKNVISTIGLMSGTSLDGLDVCSCTFEIIDGKWSFKINAARAYSYPDDLKYKLGTGAQNMSALEFITFHSQYGEYLGNRVNEFIAETGVSTDIIASHGHTIFHQPKQKIMFQIGDGAAIAATTGIPTVSDFRRLDIMLGGQGAPLVPIGDRMLFGEYDYCLNIGGFSNISFEKQDRRIAYDISPANYIFNHYCREIGLEYDKDGDIAKTGQVNKQLFEELNNLDYYKQSGPKSLGREWVESCIFPMIDSYNLPLNDRLCTTYEHAAYQIAQVVDRDKSLLITGGGAFNKFLVERIKTLSQCNVIIPDKIIIEFKEALIFALLGALYMHDTNSCLSSVTGASKDNIGGCLFK